MIYYSVPNHDCLGRIWDILYINKVCMDEFNYVISFLHVWHSLSMYDIIIKHNQIRVSGVIVGVNCNKIEEILV